MSNTSTTITSTATYSKELPNVTSFVESNFDIMNGKRIPSDGTQFDRDAIISIVRDIIFRKNIARQTAYDAFTTEINEWETIISHIQTANETECDAVLQALCAEIQSIFNK